jgi:hypothetical protein
MHSQTIPPFWKLYEKLPLEIQHLADRAFAQFESDPFHPSLRFKEVNAKRKVWSARINDDYRALGFRRDAGMIWFWIGDHREYDTMLSRLRHKSR